MKKVAIIGGGAAGLVTAINAAGKDIEVFLFDKNSNFGKKILATGNGHCNYWNEDISLEHYHSSEEEMLKNYFAKLPKDEVVPFFENLGIVAKVKNGYYYPYSNQASSVRSLLVKEASKKGVIFCLDTTVLDIYKEGLKFVVKSKDGLEYFDQVVIATGSKASFKTGSTGDGYLFAERFGHTVETVLPALVQVETSGSYLKKWAGVRTSAIVSLYEDNEFIKSEVGEIQLTDYGVSGICIFNLSHIIAKGLKNKKKEKLEICFLPFLAMKDEKFLKNWLLERERKLDGYLVTEFLEGILPYPLILTLLTCAFIPKNQVWGDLLETEKMKLFDMIMHFEVEATGVKDFLQAQVCSGGVKLSEVSSSLESKKVRGLYFVGEVLDVDGDCGGYNLGFAWMSGILVGKTIRGDSCDSSSTN